jgi:hypothetical protein
MKRFPKKARSRHPKRKRNWRRINENLKQRGSLTVWITQDAVERWERPERTGKPGRPLRYHDVAIQTGYAVKAIYGMPLRQTEGFLRSVFLLMGLAVAVPDCSTLPRRMPGMHIVAPRRTQPGESVHMVIDSTGLKVFGAGEWHEHKHGLRKIRVYRKLHLLVDADTGEILESELTDSATHDGEMLPIFLERNDTELHALSADGAYDQQACYEALAQRAARVIIPPRCDAIIRHDDDPNGAWAMRNENVQAIEKLGLERWKHKQGYYRQSIAENAMSRYKTIFGERLSSRLFASQKNEAKLNCIILNAMLTLSPTPA